MWRGKPVQIGAAVSCQYENPILVLAVFFNEVNCTFLNLHG